MTRLLPALAAGLLAGCDRGPTPVPVAGTLSAGGKPVAGITVHLAPVHGHTPGARDAYGQVDDRGNFTLRTQELGAGVIPGRYLVLLKPPDFGPSRATVGSRYAELGTPLKEVDVPAEGIAQLDLAVEPRKGPAEKAEPGGS
ncbi:MAG: hypothetical protein C0501_15450 [Isosphaera sp.]|nr:hypothetical protein [Isosphaera sp.]